MSENPHKDCHLTQYGEDHCDCADAWQEGYDVGFTAGAAAAIRSIEQHREDDGSVAEEGPIAPPGDD